MSVSLPERVGRYPIEAVVGTGGFATVYRARDERLEATVAVKVLAENHAHDPEVRERFLAEGRLLRRVNSAHVVTVHDLGETERGQPYLVLDYADRGDLAHRATERRAAGWRPGPGDVVLVAEALGDALAAVHANQLVHRDVAPRNLLLRSTRGPGARGGSGLVQPDEQLLLADLGLTKDLATASGLTVGGGTAGFAPPEHRSGVVDHVTAAADIWGASAVTVWLLVDRPPDDAGRWRAEVADQGWSPAFVAALERGLATDPQHRHGSVATWCAALRDAVGPVPVPSAIEAVRPVLRRRARLRRPRPAVGALVAATLFGSGAGLAVLVDRAGDDSQVERTERSLGGGTVKIEAAQDGRYVSITGPDTATAGEPVQFEAGGLNVERSFWIGPDGQVHLDTPRLEVTPRTAGQATVTLIGVDPHGRHITATHTFTIE